MREWTIHASDAMGRDLVVVDGDGKKIDGLLEVTVYADPRNGLRASVDILGVAVNVKVKIDTVYFRCPSCEELVSHDCELQTLGGT